MLSAQTAAATAAAQAIAARKVASWYGEKHRGKPTASGEPFNPDAMTCASNRYPLNTLLTVSHNGKTVTVRVNDRGPAAHLNREVDLSRGAFVQLADPDLGLITVTITPK